MCAYKRPGNSTAYSNFNIFFFIGLCYTANYSTPLPGLRVSILHLLLVFLRKYTTLSLLSFSGTQLLCSVRSQDLLMEADAVSDKLHFFDRTRLARLSD